MPPHTHPYSEVVTVISGTIGTSHGETSEKERRDVEAGLIVGVPRKTRTLRLDWKRGGILQVQFIGPGGIDYINPADDPASSSRLGNLRHAHTTTDTVAQRFAVRVLHTPRAIRRTVRAIAAPGNRLEQPTPVYVAIVGLVSAAGAVVHSGLRFSKGQIRIEGVWPTPPF